MLAAQIAFWTAITETARLATKLIQMAIEEGRE